MQTTPLCLGVSGPTPCVENRRWTVGGVTYATLNVQGSCNNLCDTAPDPAEYAARNAADIAWLQRPSPMRRRATRPRSCSSRRPTPASTCPTARGRRCAIRRRSPRPTASPTASSDFLVAPCATRSIAFRKPVAYVHGDSHYFRVDKPFQDALGRRLENFTRVETFGDNQANGNNDVHWLKVLVDPRSREVFAYQPQIVPANRIAVPAP